MKSVTHSSSRRQPRFYLDGKPDLRYIIKGSTSLSFAHTRRMHRHPFLEIHYAVRGKCVLHVEQEEIITQPGQLVIFNADDFHAENLYEETPGEFYSIALNGLRCADLPAHHLIAPGISHAVSLEQYESLFHSLSDSLYRETRSSENAASPVVRQMTELMAQLILSVLETTGTLLPDPAAPAEYLSARVKRYLCYHFEEDITLEKLAHLMNTSSSTISHVFKQYSGISPMQYLQRIRIGEAQTLLGSSDLSVQEIALRVGYNSPDNMYLVFRRHVGMSPVQYRKAQKNLQTKNDL